VGARTLSVYENGIGAINIPHTDAQLGAQATRGCHPLALRKMSELISAVAGVGFEVQNPFIFATKGELCTDLAAAGLGAWALDTISCDAFPQRVAGTPECGVCTSCLLRRQALIAAGIEQPGRRFDYRYDLLDPSGSVPERKLRAYRAVRTQALRIGELLSHPDPWPRLAVPYPRMVEARDVLASRSGDARLVERQLLDLYQRHCREWAEFERAVTHARLRGVA
jgi:Queuosine biosynthesis protein QueC